MNEFGHTTIEDKLGMTQELLDAQLAANSPDTLISPQISEHTFSRDQATELARTDLDFLASLAMPGVFEYDFPPVLKAAWQLLWQSMDNIKLFPQIALGIPRGHAKTTFIKLFALGCVLFSEIKFIAIFGSVQDNAVNILSDIEDMLEARNIKNLFGDWRLGIEINKNDLKVFGFRSRVIALAALGAGGSVRGLNIKNSRPDLIIFEDLQTKECSESQTQSQALERWMIGTAMKAKSPHGCLFVFIGNMYPGPNSILRKLKSNPNWIKFISGAILLDGTALWPALRPIESLIQELDNDITMGHPEIFFSEVLNDTEAGINTRTDLSNIKPWPWGKHEKPQGKFIIIDPASNKKGGDSVAIGLFEVYDATPGFRKMIEENLSPGNTIRKALLMALQNGVGLIAVESNAYQYSLLYWFTEISAQLDITGIQFVDVYSGSYSKNSRITDMLKALTAGETILHEDVRPHVVHQISNWNPLKRDNTDGLLDLLTYAPRVMELYGSMIMTDEGMIIEDTQTTEVSSFSSAF